MDKKIRVMIVDDNAMMRMGLATLLKFYPDIEISGEAADGLEAVERARDLKPDVILMDFNMPNMNGLEATRIILEQQPDTRIIGLSIKNDPETVAAMSAAGAVDHLGKDCDICTLLAAIRRSAGIPS